MQLEILNKKETKNILKLLDNQFEFKGELDYVFLKSTKNKIYIINKEPMQHTENLRIDTLGLYFGELRNNNLRLSIDGTQLIGPECNKGIIQITKKQVREWMRGEDLLIKTEYQGQFVIIESKGDFLGCGRSGEDRIKNFISKSRKLNII